MKKIYSLQVFLTEVKKIAAEVGEDYCSVTVKANSWGETIFKCYINNYHHHDSNTMEGALQKLSNEINKVPDGVDVEIEEPVKEFNV